MSLILVSFFEGGCFFGCFGEVDPLICFLSPPGQDASCPIRALGFGANTGIEDTCFPLTLTQRHVIGIDGLLQAYTKGLLRTANFDAWKLSTKLLP